MAANKNAKKLQKSKPIERSEEKTKLISLSTISTILIGKSLKSNFFRENAKIKTNIAIWHKKFLYFPGLFFGGLHMYHVSSLYENDRSFSLLSTMEREMSFRTEMVIFPSFFAARKQQSWLRCYLDKWLPLNFPLSKKKGWSGSSHFLEVEDPKKRGY